MPQESEQVLAIRQRYQLSLADKAAMIQSYIVKINFERMLNQSQLDELYEFLHKLAGSSGMYGFSDIAQVARETMQTITGQDQATLSQSLDKVYTLLSQHQTA